MTALASSVMPITSDSSAVTSVTASPLDSQDPTNLLIELKIPLPPSTSLSNHDRNLNDHDPGDEKSLEDRGDIEAKEKPEASDVLGRSTVEEYKASIVEPDLDAVPWKSLTRLAEEERYERWRFKRLEQEANDFRLSDGLSRRLADTSSIAYGNLIDQFKGDDQAGFTGLFEATERLSDNYSTLIRGRTARQGNGVPPVSQDHDEPVDGPSPFHQLPSMDQDVVLGFLNKLRTDLDYLSELISDLPPPELAALTSYYHPAGVDLSILSNHSHGRTQAYSRDSQMMKLSRRMDNIDLFHKRDPYFALLYTLFDSSARRDSQEYQLKQEVWARTCAKVMIGGKFGSEEFAIATVDSFVSTEDWHLEADLEMYLLQVLAEGWFILEPPEEEPIEKADSTLEPERASHAISVAEFFDKHVRKLLDILTSRTKPAIPRDALSFIRATLSHMRDNQMRELAKKFIVSRWYFASFLTSLLVYPEVSSTRIHLISCSSSSLIGTRPLHRSPHW